MTSSKDKKTRITSNYEYVYSSFKKEVFEIEDYVQHPPMIRKLKEDHDLAHAYSNTLEIALEKANSTNIQLEIEKKEKDARLEEATHNIENLKKEIHLAIYERDNTKERLEEAQSEKHKSEIDLAKTKSRLEEVSRNSFIQLLVSTAATIVLGFGVNIVTTISSDWKGWTLVTVGIVLTIIAFFVARKNT